MAIKIDNLNPTVAFNVVQNVFRYFISPAGDLIVGNADVVVPQIVLLRGLRCSINAAIVSKSLSGKLSISALIFLP